MPSFGAVLDACVLIPAPLCDVLLRAAENGLYQIYWSEDILSEVERNLIRQLNVREERAARRVRLMREAFTEALVEGYQRLIPGMTNPLKDRHVIAAAVVSGSQFIVTSNLKDFPDASLQDYEIQAQSPDSFLMRLFESAPNVMTQIVQEQAHALTNPRSSVEDVLQGIARDAPEFASRIREQIKRSS